MKSISEYLMVSESTLSSDKAMNLLKGVTLDKKTLNIDISIDNNTISNDKIKEVALKRAMGHILEGYVCDQLDIYYNQMGTDNFKFEQITNRGNKESFDFKLTDKATGDSISFEVKAFIDWGNNKFTTDQASTDYILGIQYSISGTSVTIKDLVLFTMSDKSKKTFRKYDTKSGFRLE